MVINGVNFNREWAQTVKEEVFIKHSLPVVWQDLPEPQRKEKLSEAYKLLMGEKPVAAERPAETGKPETTEQPEQPKTTRRAKAKAKPEETNEGAE
jgi:hypothetical protein